MKVIIHQQGLFYISTLYTAEDMAEIERIRRACFPPESLLQDHPLASRIVDGMKQLMKAFPDADYNSEAGRWQLYNLVWWMLRPERAAKDLERLIENKLPSL